MVVALSQGMERCACSRSKNHNASTRRIVLDRSGPGEAEGPPKRRVSSIGPSLILHQHRPEGKQGTQRLPLAAPRTGAGVPEAFPAPCPALACTGVWPSACARALFSSAVWTDHTDCEHYAWRSVASARSILGQLLIKSCL